MKSIPRCRIGIAVAERFDMQRQGAFTLVKGVEIGRGFHWNRKVDFLIPGELYLVPQDDDKVQLIAEMDIETYLEGVISSEMSPEAPIEFLKAHAIISRSWVMRKILGSVMPSEAIKDPDKVVMWEESGIHEGFHICCDDHCQRYQGHGNVNDKVREAVAATAGIVLFAPEEKEIADARFSKCCGGVTERYSTAWADIDKSYLKSLIDPHCVPGYLDTEDSRKALRSSLKGYDLETTADSYFLWRQELDPVKLADKIQRQFLIDIGEIKQMEPVRISESGRIIALKIIGTSGEFTIGKELAIRRLLAEDCLKSSRFIICRTANGKFQLTGYGWGHGVGLCQIGAATMAVAGHTAESILKFYFPNTLLCGDYANDYGQKI